jgi:tetratricopeptide (TPR) repeat protein
MRKSEREKPYKITKEDVEKAENTMTEEQEEMSKKREEASELEKEGEDGSVFGLDKAMQIYKVLEDDKKVKQLAKKIIETGGQDPADLQYVAIAYEELGNKEKAKEVWLEYADFLQERLAMDKYISHQMVAESYIKAGKYQYALKLLREAEKLPHPNFETLAKVYASIGDDKKAGAIKARQRREEREEKEATGEYTKGF